MRKPPMRWTPDEVAALTTHWLAGLTVNEIGRRMGINRNQVVGKVHRLKLPERPSPIRVIRVEPVALVAASRVALKPPRTCLHPDGCKAPVARGSYCAEHAAVCYRDVPAAERRIPL